MNWLELSTPAQIEVIKKESVDAPVLIFKHSTRCHISRAVLDRLERNWNKTDLTVKFYFLDLLSFREISSQIAAAFDVQHESPQLLIIKNGQAAWSESHFGIDVRSIEAALQNVKN